MTCRLVRLAVAALAFAFIMPAPARAELTLAVSPMVIELKGPPGSSQHGAVTVRNNGSTAETVTLSPIAWSVRENGDFSIDTPPRTPDRNITPYLAVSQSQVVLQPNETRTILVAATLPQVAGRSYWGGYLVQAGDGHGILAGATVVVYADPGAVRRHLRFNALDVARSECALSAAPSAHRRSLPRGATPPARVRPQNCLTATVQNDSDGYCRTGAHLVVTRVDDGRTVLDEPLTVAVVLPGQTRKIAKPLGDLAPGRYALRLTLDYGADHVVDGEKSFTVK